MALTALTPLLTGARGAVPWAGVGLAATALVALLYRWRQRSRPGEVALAAPAAPPPDGPHEPLDDLTGLRGTGYLRQKLSSLSAADACPRALTLLTIEVDRQAGVDRTTETGAGKQALVEVAQAVQGILRSGDTCVRGTRADLMALFPGLDADSSRTLVSRLRQAVESLTLVTHTGGEVSLGVTVGRAFMPQDGDTLDALVEAARRDVQARRGGRRGNSAPERLSRAVPIISN